MTPIGGSTYPSKEHPEGRMDGPYFVDGFGNVLINIHSEKDCEPGCTIHSPTSHHMRGMPLLWRNDRKMFERICDHGIGHPDPDQIAYFHRVEEQSEFMVEGSANAMGIHGCDGCCHA